MTISGRSLRSNRSTDGACPLRCGIFKVGDDDVVLLARGVAFGLQAVADDVAQKALMGQRLRRQAAGHRVVVDYLGT